MKHSKIFVIALLGSVFLLTACAKQTTNLGLVDARTTVNKKSLFFISGLAQEQEIDAVGICGTAENVAEIYTKFGFVDWLLGAFTQGIFTPRSYSVSCKKPPSAL